MQNLIDAANHILCYSTIFCGFEEVNEEMHEDAIRLLLKHGDFIKDFVKVYLDTQEDERNECH